MTWPQPLRIAVAILGTPVEIVRRLFGWEYKTDGAYTYTCPETNRTLHVPDGYPYDSFTLAPNLRCADGKRSRAAAVHDTGWQTAKWDDGSRMTFDEANMMFEHELVREGHPPAIIDAYVWGVSLPIMRRHWEKIHGPDHPAPVYRTPRPCMDV